LRRHRSLFGQSTCPIDPAGDAPRGSRDIFGTSIYRSRRADELRNQPDGCVPSNGYLHRPHPQGREARGPASHTVHEGLAGHQRRDRHDAWPHRAAIAAFHRRRGDRVKRREFITLLGGAAAAWPLAARAQQKLPTIGFLGSTARWTESPRDAALLERLRELGWIEGRTVAIEHRWAE